MTGPLLEVLTTGPGDAEGATAGGADRLAVVSAADVGGLAPSLETVRAVRSATDLPLRVLLRDSGGDSTTGSELTRLRGSVQAYADAGADGFVFGFLGPTLEIDLDATAALVDVLDGRPWTFHRAIDGSLDHDRSWRRLVELPGLDAVLTAGSARGLSTGLDELCRRAGADPRVAALVLAGGGLEPEHVPWLARAGVRQFHLGRRVRPGRSTRAYVDAALVRSWRTLVDDAVAAAL